jgi:hypothetical protein
MSGPVNISFNRRLSFAAAMLAGVLAVVGIDRGIHSGSVFLVIMGVVIAGLPCFFYTRLTFRRRPYIVIDDKALVVDRRGVGFPWRRTVVQWSNVFEAVLRQRQGAFGMSHDLVLVVRREDKPQEGSTGRLQTSRVPVETIDLSLDLLTIPWGEIIALVQERLGKDVLTTHETGRLRKQTR